MDTIFLVLKSLSKLIPMFAYLNVSVFVLDKIRLHKTSEYEGSIITEDITDKKSLMKIDYEKIKQIIPLIEKLKNNVSEENLKTLYNNLNSLKVKRKLLLVMGAVGGFYDIVKNEIIYNVEFLLGHEILHMASSYYEKENEIELCGFRQRKEIALIGNGLNEGYTELLASRIYYKNGKPVTYKKEAKIARMLEFFFDDPKEMENLYFNHNLPGLIHKLESFASRDEVIKLINDIDSLTFLSKVPFNPTPTYNNIKIQLTLYNWFREKCTDFDKLKQLEDLVCENKMAFLAINKQKNKLHKENSYDKKIDSEKRKRK